MLQDRGAMLMGLGLGAGLMYFLDPTTGGRRRALVRDKVIRARRAAEDAARATGRDVSNRASGVAARVKGAHDESPVDDQVLVERVRAKLGRVASHPRAIEVSAVDGAVTLRGPVLEHEVARLCRAVSKVKGVCEVVDEMNPHQTAGNMPALRGEGRMTRGMWDREWSPSARMMSALVATAGVGLLARAAATRH